MSSPQSTQSEVTSGPTVETVLCKTQAATEAFAAALAMCLRVGDVVALSGPVGAGKSTLARAAIRASLANPEAEVPSPTFTLVQSYADARPVPLLHTDFYRLGSAEEADELGLEEALQQGAILVEWPEQVPGLLQNPSFHIALNDVGDDGRQLTVTADMEAWARLARSLSINAFLARHGHETSRRYPLAGDASTRAYETIIPQSRVASTLILMNAPRQSDGPPIRDGKPYSRLAHLAEDVSAFVAIGHTLQEAGFRTPAIHAADLDQGFLLCENLGSETALRSDGTPDEHRYGWAAETLAQMAHIEWSKDVIFDRGDGGKSHHVIPDYDAVAMRIELDLLPQWYAPWRLGTALPADALDEFMAIWDDLIERLKHQPQTLVLRDFHSPNIIWCPQGKGIGQVGLIDFQDALIGPTAYDVASLAQDARVMVEPKLEQVLIERYLAHAPTQDRDLFEEGYAIMAAQRATKILGIFVRLSKRDGKDGYLANLPRIEAYLNRAMRHPVLAHYKAWFDTAMKQ